jgi:flagellar hook assembly protein FlgD
MNIITVNAHGGVTNSDNTVPQYCDELQSIFPNPFNPEATVQFSVKQDGTRVRMDIFNARGQKIRTILDNKMAAGTHLTTWNGVDDQSHSVGSGVYLCRLIIGNQTFSRRMMLVK